MSEALLLSFAAFVCLALATHRIRREAGIGAPAIVRTLRVIGGVLLVAAFALSGTALTGERIVRFVAVAGLAGVAVVLIASVMPVAQVAARVRARIGPRPADR